MTVLDDLQKRARDWDQSRPRSTQVAVGWSEVGGCNAYLGFRLDREWATEEPDNWAAIRGTVLGDFLESLMTGEGEYTQVTTEYRGIPGHSDIIITADGVYDLKTTSLANSQMWRKYPGVLLQKRIQANGYAAGLVDAGKLPDPCTVGLIVIPVDGKFSDWWLHEEPFARSLADEGADRLDAVKRRMADGLPLSKDMPYQWCKDWCEFFSLCRGGDDPLAEQDITNPELAALIAEYGLATAQETAAKKVKAKIAPLIRGLRGVAGDWRISLGRPGKPGKALDEDAIRFDYLMRGEPVPEVNVPGDAPKMYVRRVKK